MTALPLTRAALPTIRRHFFWIKRDSSTFARCVRGSVTCSVPLDNHDGVLSAECEDWCFDFLSEGLLVEWRGTELYVHFANRRDASRFKLRWL